MKEENRVASESPPSRSPVGIPESLIVESDALIAAPMWRREPYLLLFPTGVVLAWGGVLHWLLHSIGALPDYRPVFHAITQVQGFLMSFAVGFLFTMIPRRTGSAPPAAWEMVVAVTAPPLTAAAAWGQHWALSQAAFLILAATVVSFSVRRFLSRSSQRRPPNSFVWIPMALTMGISGSIMTGASGWLGAEYWGLHEFGRGLLLQGMFTGLALGVGALALPLMTRGEAPPDAGTTRRDHFVRLAHLAGGAILLASYWIGPNFSLRLAVLLRAGVILAVLLCSAKLWRRPRDAWNARTIWIAAWMLPLGYLFAAAFPAQFRAGLHITFLGGFALLALSVSTQVTLGHGGYSDLMFGKPRPVLTVAALMLLAMIFRTLMEFDPERYFTWMAMASVLFLMATLMWALFLMPKMMLRVRKRS